MSDQAKRVRLTDNPRRGASTAAPVDPALLAAARAGRPLYLRNEYVDSDGEVLVTTFPHYGDSGDASGYVLAEDVRPYEPDSESMTNLPHGLAVGDRVTLAENHLDCDPRAARVSPDLVRAARDGLPLWLRSHEADADGEVLVGTSPVDTSKGKIGYVRAEDVRPYVEPCTHLDEATCDQHGDPEAVIREIADAHDLDVTITPRRVTEVGAFGVIVECPGRPERIGARAVVAGLRDDGWAAVLVIDRLPLGSEIAHLRPLHDDERTLS